MITLQSRVERYTLSLPQSIHEIPAQYYEDVTNCINLPKHYAIVAVVRQVRMYDFLITLNNPKVKTRAVDIAVLVKINSDAIPAEWKIGQQVIIDESDIARGTQITPPSALTYENIISYLLREEKIVSSKEPKEKNYLTATILSGTAKDENNVPIKEHPICFMSFKIVPVTAIHGTVDNDISYNDPFIKVIPEVPAKAPVEAKRIEDTVDA